MNFKKKYIVIGLSFFLKYNSHAQEKNNPISIKTNVDSTKSIILEEVKITAKKIAAIETEKPSRKKHYSFLTKAPTQIGMIFNEEQIVGKKLNYISIYFDKKYTQFYTFQILLYTVGNDSLPSKLINKRELAFSANHEGWNKFPIQINDLIIPKEGIAVVVNFFDKSNMATGETDRIAMGKYIEKRRFFVRPTSQNNWIIFNSFQEGRIGPMIRLSVDE
ncbi:hypothetical protein G9H62_12570 [Aquirufa ecclesiirivi]|uniref:hypothetical protein n=1 Tax=Aquirufa ecclesiirivi TaxID=2715124 RepID=UPI0022A8205B|nr:hypothetical protein [Aquirufa ecclesiirivi]MCZ2473683.1 hypothetical protein [Aquirufa ecclesiirivi]